MFVGTKYIVNIDDNLNCTIFGYTEKNTFYKVYIYLFIYC